MNFHFNWDYLKKPWIILSGIFVGALIGLFCPTLGIKLAPLGNAYISLLSMCVIPIMVTAIITSISRMFHSVEAGFFFKRIAAVFLLGLFITSALGLSLAVIVKPGMNMSQDKMVKIGQALIKGENETVSTNAGSTGFDLNTLLKMLIPENIFKALSNGMNLQILFFSIIFGISTGFLPRPKSELIIDISDAVFKAFEKAIFLIMYLLPFGLICMLSGQFATAGLDMLLAMIKFVLLIYLVGLILVLLASLLICLKTKKNILQVIKDLQDPLVIALGTSNTFATMPSVFQALHDNFHLPSQLTNLIVPLSIVICRYGTVLTVTLGTVFMAQVYKVPLSFEQCIFILCMSVLAGIAGAGAPGIVALSLISMVMTPLGLPATVAITLLIAIHAIIAPINTVINAYMSCTAAILIIDDINISREVEQHALRHGDGSRAM